MKIIKLFFFGIVALIILLGVIGLFLPHAQHVEREITINAPADKIYPYLNNFKNFNQWSPWASIDPNTRYTFEGPESGVGAKMRWNSSDKNVGIGSQEIIESITNTQLKSRLTLGPGEPALASFDLRQHGAQTTVRWSFDTDLNSTISRYFGLMLDKWVGASYTEGLYNLKKLIESS